MQNNLTTPFKPLTLIKAGAGAGKTFHIQKTLVEWIEQGHVQPDRILAVTFTEAGAQEMKQRIKQALVEQRLFEEADRIEQSQISTIHSFGLGLIERFCYEQGISAKPQQLSDKEQDVLVSLALKDVALIEEMYGELKAHGYKGYFCSTEERQLNSAEVLKKHIKEIVPLLKMLANLSDKSRVDSLQQKIKCSLENIYQAQSFKEVTLNKGLYDAVAKITSKYKKKELRDKWGTNPASRKFVDALYQTSKERVAHDWSLWVDLGWIEAPNIWDKKTGEPKDELDGQLGVDVWSAADKLVYHKGPLNSAIKTTTMLIQGIVEALTQYQTLKSDSSLIDYSDMVSQPNALLADEEWLKEVKANYDCLIIDEFQDTNPQQFSLLWKLSRAGINTLVVGDIKQSIMGFQGSDSYLFQSLLEQHPNDSVELTNNWRSSDKVMGFVNQLGAHLYGDDYQSLTPQANLTSDLSAIHRIEFDTNEWQTQKGELSPKIFDAQSPDVIAEHIDQLLKDQTEITDRHTKQKRPIRPNDIAILARTNKHLDKYSTALTKRGLLVRRKNPEKIDTDKDNWLTTPEIRYLWSGLSFLANPNDNEAKLSLKVHSNEASLEKALQDIVASEEDKHKFQSEILTKLERHREKLPLCSVSEQVSQCIESLSLLSPDNLGAEREKQRSANVLKMVGLAEEFEQLNTETLSAQGIYGRSLSSFLTWLTVNKKEFTAYPCVDNDSLNAVNLVTWHGSKGLEWPVVVVAKLEEVQKIRYPETKIRYDSNNAHENNQLDKSMLDDAWIEIIPQFAHPKTVEKFDDKLADEKADDLKNLCYVALTRAREQIILPWFDQPEKNNTMMALIRDLDYSEAEITKAVIADEPTENESQHTSTDVVKPYKVNVESDANQAESIKAEINPSTITNSNPQLVSDTLDRFTYQLTLELEALVELDLVVGKQGHAANHVGTWLHLCYQVLLAKTDFEQRLWKKLPELAENTQLCSEIVKQVSVFKQKFESKMHAIRFQSEVPFLAKTEQGSVLSGIIDCLIETPDGLIIIDHKTDANMSQEKFEHHCEQLAAYAKYLQHDKPVIAIGINWVRDGRIELKSVKELKPTESAPMSNTKEPMVLAGEQMDMFAEVPVIASKVETELRQENEVLRKEVEALKAQMEAISKQLPTINAEPAVDAQHPVWGEYEFLDNIYLKVGLLSKAEEKLVRKSASSRFNISMEKLTAHELFQMSLAKIFIDWAPTAKGTVVARKIPTVIKELKEKITSDIIFIKESSSEEFIESLTGNSLLRLNKKLDLSSRRVDEILNNDLTRFILNHDQQDPDDKDALTIFCSRIGLDEIPYKHLEDIGNDTLNKKGEAQSKEAIRLKEVKQNTRLELSLSLTQETIRNNITQNMESTISNLYKILSKRIRSDNRCDCVETSLRHVIGIFIGDKNSDLFKEKTTYTLHELACSIEVEVDSLEERLEECLEEEYIGQEIVFVDNPRNTIDLHKMTMDDFQPYIDRENLICNEDCYECKYVSFDCPTGSSYTCEATYKNIELEDFPLELERIINYIAINEDNEGVYKFLINGEDPYE
ncbi:UvrD-helicase domain-containing protein [Vibrio sp. 1F255]|uniref:UvrD-helicase domain-containing protein n=1 Tax=Vibrio sp. 1F255 TaxID=3230009 RepID=UPI00352F5D07